MENNASTMKVWFCYNWLKLLAIIFLLGTFGNFPYAYYRLTAYYQLMNWIVAGASLMTVYQAWQQSKTTLAWSFMFIAVIFNPLALFYLRDDIWKIIDIVVILSFIISFYLIRPRQIEKKKVIIELI